MARRGCRNKATKGVDTMTDPTTTSDAPALLASAVNLLHGFAAVAKNDGKLLRRTRESDLFLGSLLSMSLVMLFVVPVSDLRLPHYTLLLFRDWLEEIETVATDGTYDEQEHRAIREKLRQIEAELREDEEEPWA